MSRSPLALRLGKIALLFAVFGVAAALALRLHGGGLWDGLAPAVAATSSDPANKHTDYDLPKLQVANEVIKTIRDRYVDPKRVKPKEMLLSALNYIQRDVAQIIVLHEDGAPTVKVRVDTQEKEYRVDNVLGPWDVSARLKDIFTFIQDGLKGSDVDLREVEYAACNGMLHTLDPHSVLLSPEAYKEMNLSTSGQFGGLGMVVSIRDQMLTVINPMPNTPTGKAGIKKYDRITKINGESTLNMGLNEAVQHLRGAPGSKVTLWLKREATTGDAGWKEPRPFDLVRETIHVESVEHKLLDGNIGYVRLKQFQASSSSDLDNALTDMKKAGDLKGLVLDLRGNPGGLLDQAAKIVDKFVADGPIVATVGNPSEGRDEKEAKADGTEPNYPLVLLVSGSSASASEIVAGALKNHDRAVLIGETTFGKGSVQLIFSDLADKAALKLTIAQYLTEPGDISIQGTGVTPDIELDPMTVDPQEMDLSVDSGMLKERDLARSLSNARIREGQKPLETVRYSLPEKERQEMRERGGEPDEQFAMDFPIKFAREIAAKIPQGKRPDEVRAAKSVIEATRAAELAKVAADLGKLGFDWSDAPADVQMVNSSTGPLAGVEVKVETDKPNNEVTAGESMTLKVTVTNNSPTTLYRLYATAKSDNPLFDNKELAFGKIEPGKSRTATAPMGWCDIEGHKVGSTAVVPKDAPRVCTIVKDSLTRSDGIKLHFEEAKGRIPADAEARVTVHALERPIFAYGYQIADNVNGNGDGRVQRGESVTMYVTIKNVGKGRSYESQANLRNLSGDGVLLHEGRFDVSDMQPGDTKKVTFTFDVNKDLADNEAKVELSVTDKDLREVVVEKVRMPIVPQLTLAAATGAMRAKASGASIFEAPDGASRMFGHLAAGTSVNEMATSGDFTKVSLGGTRFGFVRSSELDAGGSAPTGSAGGAVAFEDALAHAPPTIEIGTAALTTKDSHVMVKGVVADSDRLLDAYIFVGARKVFYHSNRNGSDPKKMPVEADLPLRPGVNVITLMARENPDTTGRKTFIIRRDGPNGELLQTPKTDDELSENGAAEDD